MSRKAKSRKKKAPPSEARVIVPWSELHHRLALVDRVLRLRDDSRRVAEDAQQRRGKQHEGRAAKISLAAIREAYHQDPSLSSVPFRSLYQLALARVRVGDRLEDLVRRLGQGKALEIAMLTEGDRALREQLLTKGRRLKTQGGRLKRIEQMTIAELRAYIAAHRHAPTSKRPATPRLPGGKRGPRVRWPEYLVRVLAPLLNETTWGRLREAFERSKLKEGSVPSQGSDRSNGTRSLPRMGRRQLKAIQTRVKELAGMVGATIKDGRRSAP